MGLATNKNAQTSFSISQRVREYSRTYIYFLIYSNSQSDRYIYDNFRFVDAGVIIHFFSYNYVL